MKSKFVLMIVITALFAVARFRYRYEEYNRLVHEKDSVVFQCNRFQFNDYKDFVIYTYLLDTLLNYHRPDITKEQISDFFSLDKTMYLQEVDDSTFEFPLESFRIVCKDGHFHRLIINPNHKSPDSIIWCHGISRLEMDYYLTNKQPFHRTLKDWYPDIPIDHSVLEHVKR